MDLEFTRKDNHLRSLHMIDK